MKPLGVILLVVLCGCSTIPGAPALPAPAPEGLCAPPVARAVCVVHARTLAGTTCPGCDVDLANVPSRWPWMRGAVIVANGDATIENCKAAIRAANDGLAPSDVLMVYWSGHGGYQEDTNGDEEDGRDETLLCSGTRYRDALWVDDDVWAFICTLRPCRLVLVTDTCHSEGNWRTVARALTFGLAFKARPVQLELFESAPRAVWSGEIVQLAASRADQTALGYQDVGGLWTSSLTDHIAPGMTLLSWFSDASSGMPSDHFQAISTYNASDDFMRLVFLE